MPVKDATPGRGKGPSSDHFSYWEVPPEKIWTGWLAGPVKWIEAHTGNHPTKICVAWATDDEVPCVRCSPKKPTETVGYVPLYREIDGAPKFVIVYDDCYDFLKDLRHPNYIRIVREGGEKERVTVQKVPSQKRYETSLKRRLEPVDISEMLVKLWSVAEYTTWYECKNPHADVRKSTKNPPAAPAPVPPGTPVLDVQRVAAILDRNSQKSREMADVSDAISERLKQYGKPSANGHSEKK
jgi:hypothetical protein